MSTAIEQATVREAGDGLSVRLRMGRTKDSGKPEGSLGWQFFDPETSRFVKEGAWIPLDETNSGGEMEVQIPFPPEPGPYRVYVSEVDERGWAYARGQQFLVVDAEVEAAAVRLRSYEVTTAGALRRRSVRRAVPKLFSRPVRTIAENRKLIGSMARRDILARYRGSFGDMFWTVLNPLILMATYFFVFGVVLRARLGPDQTKTGFALYFLAGMLPWLAFSEAAGRAPQVVVEHRSFVKKLIFPLDTLPVNVVLAGLITEVFAMGLFLVALLVIRHSVPVTALWLPLLVIPQALFTVGLCWLLAALGVFFRDLGQIMGFVLTLWFFVTPICYAEASLPPQAMVLLRKNPLFVLVRAYRACLLEGHAPDPYAMAKLAAVAVILFFLGHAFFARTRKSFADVL